MELVTDAENNIEALQYLRARKKAKDIRGFYVNLASYCIVIPILIYVNLTFSPDFYWFFFSATGWGIGLIFHGLGVYNITPFFGRDWGTRKVAELMKNNSAQNAAATTFYDYQKSELIVKRVQRIRSFYGHLAAYIVVNLGLLALNYFSLEQGESFWEWSTFSTAIFWGIGLFFHALGMLVNTVFLGSEWENKKMEELVGKQTQQKWE